MNYLKEIQLHRADIKLIEKAHILRLTENMAERLIDSKWWDLPEVSQLQIKNEGDNHWEWKELIAYYASSLKYEAVAVMSQMSYLEGAMIYQFDAKSKLEKGKGSVYIGWLATAPRNRKWLGNKSFYKGIGSMLIYWAIEESYNFGFDGRITLQSLPTPSTIRFYENKGFIRTDLTQSTKDLVDYELPKDAAIKWLKEEGDLP